MARYAKADPIWMMTPRSRGSMRSSAARVPCTVPRYVTSVTRRYSAGRICFTGEKTETIALLTQRSIGPKRASTEAAASVTAWKSETSAGSTSAWPPSCSTSVRARASRAAPLARSPSRAPRRASARTTARPTPAEAPVTTATRGVAAMLLDPHVELALDPEDVHARTAAPFAVALESEVRGRVAHPELLELQGLHEPRQGGLDDPEPVVERRWLEAEQLAQQKRQRARRPGLRVARDGVADRRAIALP